jgi:hypothetical protein
MGVRPADEVRGGRSGNARPAPCGAVDPAFTVHARTSARTNLSAGALDSVPAQREVPVIPQLPEESRKPARQLVTTLGKTLHGASPLTGVNMPAMLRAIIVVTLLLGSASACTDAGPAGTRAVELTFLKALPGQRENLKRFIVLNWFAMDRIAREQGLLHAYTIMDTGSDAGTWNIMVSTTYRDGRGYAGVEQAFARIRESHRTVLVDGKALEALGSVVDSIQLLEDPADAAP